MLARSIVFVCLSLLALSAQARTVNGFDVRDASVPSDQIQHGGPPRDGIPALDAPRFELAAQATWLAGNSLILGLRLGDDARAYPIDILNWHELVNDQVGQVGVLVSYCPLCGTGMAFASDVNGQRLQFGVSGLLYNSDVLFYDRQTDSLWSQIDRTAISGPQQGTRLQQIPLRLTTWAQWRADQPTTKVLAQDQGFSRDYQDDPYAGYEKTRRLFFEVAAKIPDQYHPKERVLGLRRGDVVLALPFSELRSQGLAEFNLEFAGQQLTVHWDAQANVATVRDVAGHVAEHTIAFWFAWYAFHPNTRVFTTPG